MAERVAIQVHGRVQGVGFRWYTREKAVSLGLTGIVRNLPDGTVGIEAEGGRSDLETFLSWVSQGPPHAVVESTDVRWLEARNEDDNFRIMG